MDNAEVISGEIDVEKFNKGGYIIIQGHENSKIKAGDKINLKYLTGNVVEDGYTENEFEVMAILDGGKNFSMSLFLNEDDFKSVEQSAYIEKIVINADKKDVKNVEEKVRKINENIIIHILKFILKEVI